MSSSDLDFLESSKTSLDFLNSTTQLEFNHESSTPNQIYNSQATSNVQKQLYQQKSLIKLQRQQIQDLKQQNNDYQKTIKQFQYHVQKNIAENAKIIEIAKSFKLEQEQKIHNYPEISLITDLFQYISNLSVQNSGLFNQLQSVLLNAQSFILGIQTIFQHQQKLNNNLEEKLTIAINEKQEINECLKIQQKLFQLKLKDAGIW